MKSSSSILLSIDAKSPVSGSGGLTHHHITHTYAPLLAKSFYNMLLHVSGQYMALYMANIWL